MVIIFLFLIIGISSKVCIKTFEEERSNINSIENKMNNWISSHHNINIINLGTYRSDDRYNWYHGGYISYYCESVIK